MLELAGKLLKTGLGELLSVERLLSLVERVVRVDRVGLAVLLVEEAEVVDRQCWRRLLVEGRDLVQDANRLFVVTLGQEELGAA